MPRLDFLTQANADYISQLEEQWRADPDSVPPEWQIFFTGVDAGAAGNGAAREEATTSTQLSPASGAAAEPVAGVYDLIHSYRELGHLIAEINPLGGNETEHPLLDLSEFGFTTDDLARVVECPSLIGVDQCSVGELVERLRATYCRTIGVEYMHIAQKELRSWLQERIEPSLNTPTLDGDARIELFRSLSTAAQFEQFLHTKYVGQKRFSLEGSEALVPLLHELIESAGNLGVQEIVMGMPHRGRLNVLANVLHKPYEYLFAEFEGSFLPNNIQGDGDVKYHLGYSRDHVTKSGSKVHVSLLYNPSHLEAVNPVVTGIVHAKQDYLRDTETRSRVIPLLLHGDAAFVGQGLVTETLALSELSQFHVGGTIHVIVDNQIGFTTSPRDARFTRYPSDVAKVFNAPVFHVNADDPEAVIQAARLAIEFRAQFKEDVIIHLVCYRRHGHNELDDPTFTQPGMYKIIREKTPVHQMYASRLSDAGVLSEDDATRIQQEIRDVFDKALGYARDEMPRQRIFAFGGAWEGMGWAGRDWTARTAVSRTLLERVIVGATSLPDTFTPHPKTKKLLEERRKMLEGDGKIDWACGELLAFGTLLLEGTNVRLSGQDSQRGTFSQRHAVLHDAETDEIHVPLSNLAAGQGRFRAIDSMLSEAGVLGFEYGYSSADPRNLVLWEAQFGDFANGAQVVIDQFIASAESKWQRQCGIVLLLPHGYEGQGPEHSSARLERYLQLSAENNIQVVYPTTPAQYFHALRRQIHRRFRKPLVVMTPKSMLRMQLAVSPVCDFSDGGFLDVIDEIEPLKPEAVRRVLLCSGKVYYDLLVNRTERVIDNVAIVRVEQLYPFPADQLSAVLGQYPEDAEVDWVQEESINAGAWSFVHPRIDALIGPERRVRYVGRDEGASPATGSYKLHQQELVQLLNEAFRKVQPATVTQRRAHVGRGSGTAAR
jgi:2-oxoglutarate dehydrogenase E1 component